jgi:hypothetical protein
MIRLALAGGSDERPPRNRRRKAQIIRFPIERRIRPDQEPANEHPAGTDDSRGVVPETPTTAEVLSQHWPRVFPGL